jgi:hypothetical protein
MMLFFLSTSSCLTIHEDVNEKQAASFFKLSKKERAELRKEWGK